MPLNNSFGPTGRELRFTDKFKELNWILIGLIAAICCVGFAMLYSVAQGNLEPWAGRQMVRFGIGMAILLVVALIDITSGTDSPISPPVKSANTTMKFCSISTATSVVRPK